jgi:hypothetical protein
MAGKPRYTQQEVIAALEATRGLASAAALRLGCKYDTVLNYQRLRRGDEIE